MSLQCEKHQSRPILAAGGVLWRMAPGIENPEAVSGIIQNPYTPDSLDAFEFMVVHRPRYDDWSLPKGKLEPGELLVGCAVREIAEETGIQACLGPLLAQTSYQVQGRDKHVSYWLAEARNTPAVLARGYVQPASESEVDQRRWVTPQEAQRLLTSQFDRYLADLAARKLQAGWGSSRAMILLRHGKAKNRAKWDTDDALRPLKKRGKMEAKSLITVLSAFGVSRVWSSPWTRCTQTVKPYLKKTLIQPVFSEVFSEEGFADDPVETVHAMRLQARRTVETFNSSVICTHNPVLGVLVDELGLAQAPLNVGESLVVHLLADGSSREGAGRGCDPTFAGSNSSLASFARADSLNPLAIPQIIGAERHLAVPIEEG